MKKEIKFNKRSLKENRDITFDELLMMKKEIKKRKVLDIVKEWLHSNCVKGEVVEVTQSSNAIVIVKINPADCFIYTEVKNPRITTYQT